MNIKTKFKIQVTEIDWQSIYEEEIAKRRDNNGSAKNPIMYALTYMNNTYEISKRPKVEDDEYFGV